ncbi:uncharacterized protein L3040_005071 [Drepanopeziza brunnea f. sp. 'multigermtubi']|uniref:Ubiquitin carboxyl-terminal hydrolase n=1 Tax=Marssonina brunnea f. sp. multigermtubi (strain MB_m1) TaxID=1072389 RepID=K1X9R3_MARBU|nr:putative ubiquitin carboxyl-terminal hydrolase isozyme L3 [Drepanopeziza brunnea f. sp. 'multigermtubi' MB_m1]EKD17468.1 putative ubiquitin carboxyl-terminal hydrolase isozyme L3 [Drepanopeziza brunnea f. sp. 'multigermtubi' MB_m1]KAJ5042528.1 hypothetical protein L3040_005071 [Drepanopeziza brunnea f. sp. 'multigermtubi']
MPIPAVYVNGKKTFTVLENNPEVMNALALSLGLSPTLQFHDVYSLTEPSLLSLIPRPVHALLVIIPLTSAWHADRTIEDASHTAEHPHTCKGADDQEPIVWFKQTIGHACGSIGLLHCLLNGAARHHLAPDSTAARIRATALPLGMRDRAQMLYEDQAFEDAHCAVAELGDTVAPSAEEGDRLGQHFVAFVKAGGRLWELEGSRMGPLDRGPLAEDEDVLSQRGIALGLGRVIELEKRDAESKGLEGGDLRFSCIALAGGGDRDVLDAGGGIVG